MTSRMKLLCANQKQRRQTSSQPSIPPIAMMDRRMHNCIEEGPRQIEYCSSSCILYTAMSVRYPRRRGLLCTALLLLSEASAFHVASRQRSTTVTQPLESTWVVESVATKTKTELPPVLQGIVDERQEYHIKLGRAMDTLRNDMQTILTDKPGT
jgi:hypothetical protein